MLLGIKRGDAENATQTNAMSRKKVIILSGIIIVFAIGLIVVEAASYFYQSNPGSTVTIDEHGTCKKVQNTGAKTYFVPTKTVAEWTAFQNADAYLTDVNLGTCGGTWVLQGSGCIPCDGSCSATCGGPVCTGAEAGSACSTIGSTLSCRSGGCAVSPFVCPGGSGTKIVNYKCQ